MIKICFLLFNSVLSSFDELLNDAQFFHTQKFCLLFLIEPHFVLWRRCGFRPVFGFRFFFKVSLTGFDGMKRVRTWIFICGVLFRENLFLGVFWLVEKRNFDVFWLHLLKVLDLCPKASQGILRVERLLVFFIFVAYLWDRFLILIHSLLFFCCQLHEIKIKILSLSS